jgi:hypothetical protein
MDVRRYGAYLRDVFNNLVQRAGGGKNLLFIIVGLIIAAIVAVGWGLSELQTSQATMIEVGRLIVH